MKKIAFLLAVLFAGATLEAQVLSPQDDGLIPKSDIHYSQTRVVPLPALAPGRYALVKAPLGANFHP